jgi:NTP pyrophosphatase (non-canonical NTP hydrolase)
MHPQEPEGQTNVFAPFYLFHYSDMSSHPPTESPSHSPITSLAELTAAVNRFAEQRDWEQFHTPKNLSMALIVEAAELVEHFQWLSPQESGTLDKEKQEDVAMEMADVFIYLVRMASQLDIDLLEAAQKKIILNGKKYPIEQVKGKSGKYTQYQQDSNP